MLNKPKNKQVKITPSPEFAVLGHNITLQMQAEIYKRLASPLNGFTLADLRAAIVATLPDLMAKADKYAALDDDTTVIFFEPSTLFDDAIVGIGERPTMQPVVVYDESVILANMLRDARRNDPGKPDEYYEESVMEHFEFNTRSAWFGSQTPIITRVVPAK